MRTSIRRRVLPALLWGATAWSASACASMPFRRKAPPPPAVISFNNESTEQADVFAIETGGATTRIGTVMAGRTESIKLPESISRRGVGVNIAARMRAMSRVLTTGTLVIQPGERLSIRLPMDARNLVILPGDR